MNKKFIATLLLIVLTVTQIFVPSVFADAKSKLGNIKAELEELSTDYKGKILSNLWDFVVEKIGKAEGDPNITVDEALAEIQKNLEKDNPEGLYNIIVGDGDNQIKESTIIRLIEELLVKQNIVKAYYDTYYESYMKYFEKSEVKLLLGLETTATSGEVYAEMMNYVVPAITHNSERTEFIVNNSVDGIKGGLARKAYIVSRGNLPEESIKKLLDKKENTDKDIQSLATKVNTEMKNYGLKPDDVTTLLDIFGLYDEDPTVPKKVSTAPVNGSASVSIGASIKIVFSKNILYENSYDNISLKTGNTQLAIDKTISGNTLTIIPKSNLEYSTKYIVNIPAGAIVDEVLRPTSEAITITFTTQSSGYSTTPDDDDKSEKPEEPTKPQEPSIGEKEIGDIIADIDPEVITAASADEIDKLTETLTANLEKALELIDGIENPEVALELVKTLVEKSGVMVRKLEELEKVPEADIFTNMLNTLAETVLKKMATFRVEISEDMEDIIGEVKLGDVKEGELIDADTRKMLKDIALMAQELTSILENNGVESNIEPVIYIDAFSGIEGVSKIDLSIPTGLMLALQEEGITSVKVTSDVAVMKIPSDSISHEKGKNICIHAAKLSKEQLSDDIKKVVGDAPVYDICITVDDERVEFKKSIQVVVSYTPAKNEDTEKLTVFYIGENGVLENVIGVYVEKTGKVVFDTEHFSQYAIKLNDVKFKDVADKFWAARYIEVMASKGIIKGIGADMFKPENNVTRAEFLAMIVREFKLFDKDAENPFKDVNETDWFYPEVVSGAKFGIVRGRPGGVFAPNDKITREEMATIVSNVLTKVLLKKVPDDNIGNYLKGYNDSDKIANYAKDTVAMATRYQIFNGRPDGTFAPKDNANRSEAAKVIYILFYMKQYIVH